MIAIFAKTLKHGIMKKIVLLIVFMAFMLNTGAQNVMGINIGTTMKSFNVQMKKKGYAPYKTTLGKYEYKVVFAGYPDANFMVEYNTDTDSINGIEIIFRHESYEQDKKIYHDIKEQLIAKYGTPSYEFEKYNADLSPNILVRMTYRDVSFHSNPYLVWDFGNENNVKLKYQTTASRKVKKKAFSNDL